MINEIILVFVIPFRLSQLFFCTYPLSFSIPIKNKIGTHLNFDEQLIHLNVL